jgi:hypothetical protein
MSLLCFALQSGSQKRVSSYVCPQLLFRLLKQLHLLQRTPVMFV